MNNIIRLNTPQKRCKKKLPFPSLTFVKDQPGGLFPRDFWAVKSTGNYSADCEMGAALAIQYLDFLMQGRGGWAILQSAVQDMVAKNDRSGLVVGFMGVISRALAASMFALPGILDAIKEDDRRTRRYLDSLPHAGDGIASSPVK